MLSPHNESDSFLNVDGSLKKTLLSLKQTLLNSMLFSVYISSI